MGFCDDDVDFLSEFDASGGSDAEVNVGVVAVYLSSFEAIASMNNCAS
jgi:hypothetical protein